MPFTKDQVFHRLSIVGQQPFQMAQRAITAADLLAIGQTTAFITEAYRHLLGRDPDPEGFETHRAFLESGGNRLEFLNHLRASEEGQKKGARTLDGWRCLSPKELLDIAGDDEFLLAVYHNYLWRDPDDGATHYRNILAQGAPRAEVLQSIGASEEARSHGRRAPEEWTPETFDRLLTLPAGEFITAAYWAFLWRNPDDAGFESFAEDLKKGAPRPWILWRIGSSQEARGLGATVIPEEWRPKTFAELLAIQGEEKFLNAVYRTYLWRNPDEAGFRTFEENLRQGEPRPRILWRIESSEEGRRLGATVVPEEWRPKTFAKLLSIDGEAEFLKIAYHSYLWREPDDGGLQSFVHFLHQGAPKAHILYRIGASEEARRLESDFPPDWLPMTAEELIRQPEDTFVQAVYRTILWRDPEPEAERAYISQLLCGRLRRDVVLEIARCSEAKRLPFQSIALGPQRRWLWALGAGWVWRFRSAMFGRALQHGLKLNARAEEKLSQGMSRLEGAAAGHAEEIRSLQERQTTISSSVDRNGRHLLKIIEPIGEGVNGLSRDLREKAAALERLLETCQASVRKVQEAQKQTAFAALEQKLTRQTVALSEKLDERAAQLSQGIVQLGEAAATATEAVLVNRRILQDGLRTGRAPSQAAITLPDNLVVTRLEDLLYAIPAEDVRLAALLTFRGHLELGLHLFFERWIQPGMRIVDAGANIGLHSLVFARKAGCEGKVYCFEPSPRVFSILNLNASMNNLASTMTTREIALSDGPGVARFFVYDTCGHSSLYSDAERHQVIEVKTESLDNILDPAQKIDLIKIDVEGAEPLVLRGLSRTIQNNPDMVIVVEFAPSLLRRGGFDPREFLAEIQSLGFTVSQIDDLSGEVLPPDTQSLLNCISANLHLVKSPMGQA